jgi:hypothetical protein
LSAHRKYLTAKVIALTAPTPRKRTSNRKKKNPLPQKWNDFFWDEVVPFVAFRELSTVDRSLLMDLFNIARNLGTDTPIGCSARKAADLLKMGKSTGAQALSSLEAKGFLISVVRGLQHRKERVASNWRLSFLPFKGNPPTREYVRRHYKAMDMEAYAETKAKAGDSKESQWA